MRVVVTGGTGKVGRAAARALLDASHTVTTVDVGRPEYERSLPDEPHYLRADVTDAGAAFAAVAGAEAVVHAAAIPDPFHDPAHVVFGNNLMVCPATASDCAVPRRCPAGPGSRAPAVR